MHGGWGNERTQLGTPTNPSMLKNVIDNGIQNGDFEPFIIVCPTDNNTSPQDSANYSRIEDVIADPSFGAYGRLIFPLNESYYSGDTLKDLRLTWYNNIDPDKTVEIVNYMKTHADEGDTIFF